MKKHSLIIVLITAITSSCNNHSQKQVDGTKDLRIVSLSKQLTEYVYALGKGHDLVACDLSSTYPDSAKLLPKVGYHRALNPEGIISANPDLVIHSNDIGPDNVLPQITKAGLNIKAFGGANTIDSAKLLMKEMGQFFGVETIADSLIQHLTNTLNATSDSLKAMHITDTPKVMIIHFGRASNIYFVMSGRGGAADKMIQMAGGKVATYDGKGARQISAEAVAMANPDIIIATDFGFDQMGSMDKFIEGVPGVALTNAGKNKRIIRFEEHDLVYFGPRSGDNILLLMKLIYSGKKSR